MQQVPIRRWVLTLALSFTAASASMADSTAAEQPLYDRLGGWEGIEAVVQDTIAYHKANPDIAHYFADVDEAMLAGHVTAFFAAGTGGPAKYEGRDMMTAHAGMGLSDADYDSAVADVLKAMADNGAAEQEQKEVAAILESLRPAVMGQTGS